jgi:hypothetical protein
MRGRGSATNRRSGIYHAVNLTEVAETWEERAVVKIQGLAWRIDIKFIIMIVSFIYHNPNSVPCSEILAQHVESESSEMIVMHTDNAQTPLQMD